MASHETFSFGPFVFQTRTGHLGKHGRRLRLQPKSAAALKCLLDHPGQVVTKAMLQAQLWPEGTHVDFDVGIKVAIKKLRDTLGDDPDAPNYIQTVHGEGYRFIGALLPQNASAPGLNGSAGAQGKVVGAGEKTARFGKLTFRVRDLLRAGAVLAAIASAVLIYVVFHLSAAKFHNRDWLIIASFDNKTGEPLLDGTMEHAVERALSQSRYVNVAPRDRINDTLKLMRQNVSVVLTEDLARQVAIRDGGIKAILAGRIAKLGSNYFLTVRVLSPQDGRVIADFEQQALVDQLPRAVQSVSEDVRRGLGEKILPLTQEQSIRLERATTISAAALRAYSAGMREIDKSHWGQAAVMLEEAVLNDPEFASAHVYAAHCYANLKQDEKAAPHFQAADRLAAGVTERERLFILGSYYSRFLHDDARAVDSYAALVTLYPDDYWGLKNLAQLQLRLNRLEDRIATLERILALRPNDDDYPLLLSLFDWFRINHPDRAKARQMRDRLVRLRKIGLAPPPGWVIVDAPLDLEMVTERWMSGDVSGASRELTRVSTKALSHPDSLYKFLMATTNLTLGRLKTAKQLCLEVQDLTMQRECFLRIAYVSGDRALGLDQLSKLRPGQLSSPSGAAADIAAAAWLGDVATAQRWSTLAVDRTASDGFSGWIHLSQSEWGKAVKDLENLPIEFGPFTALWVRYPLAVALEKQGRIAEAIAALENNNVFRSTNLWTSWSWPIYYVKLARLYRKAGRLSEAEKVEGTLRHYLAAADAEYPSITNLRGPFD